MFNGYEMDNWTLAELTFSTTKKHFDTFAAYLRNVVKPYLCMFTTKLYRCLLKYLHTCTASYSFCTECLFMLITSQKRNVIPAIRY